MNSIRVIGGRGNRMPLLRRPEIFADDYDPQRNRRRILSH